MPVLLILLFFVIIQLKKVKEVLVIINNYPEICCQYNVLNKNTLQLHKRIKFVDNNITQ